MPITNEPRLLIRGKAAAHGFAPRIGKQAFSLQHLFDAPARSGFGVAASEESWYLASAPSGDENHAWDLAHQAIEQMTDLEVTAIEPDLMQQWGFEKPDTRRGELASKAVVNRCEYEEADKDFPDPGSFAWHLQPAFSQLDAARKSVGEQGKRVRVAHIDTGYDANHITLPAHLDHGKQRNFIDPSRPHDATDRTPDGFLKFPGHGTATLALLAGNKLSGMPRPEQNTGDFLGGAPYAQIVPIRAANSVAQFYTSTIAQALEYALSAQCDVVSMSLGGLASDAWADAVNRLYEAGVVVVAAAGNNFGGFPTSSIVYPARFHRVIAACGVMPDGKAYSGFGLHKMQGNYGPASKMRSAMAAYTPNTPWAEIGCQRVIDANGAGTSSATPQIAAAAALWLAQHQPKFKERWRRVEAVRWALFTSAANTDAERLGRGALRAAEALKLVPREQDLSMTPRDSASFAFLKALTGLGMATSARQHLFDLELLQLTQQARQLDDLAGDPQQPGDLRHVQRFLDYAIEQAGVSQMLRRHLQEMVSSRRPQVAISAVAPKAPQVSVRGGEESRPVAPAVPPFRRLRVFSIDPLAKTRQDTLAISETVLKVEWEKDRDDNNILRPGPVGEYVEVVDIDPASRCCYPPVNLDDPNLLAQDGLPPSEGNPQFHQQMVYAVSMNTIKHFERALGRVALWSPHTVGEGKDTEEHFVRRLRIYPHALREANAYYSPDKKALLFGYFQASRRNPGLNLPGGLVFTCLSQDVVAHETTHALLDGLHRRYVEPTNPDVRAFHEGFADIVAMFQHFTQAEVLHHVIVKTRGDLSKDNELGQLAQQFGQAIGSRAELRNAITLKADSSYYAEETEAHSRGAILVAAVFDAFLAIYKTRIADLLRLATGGTGVLPSGEIHPDLVNRLAREAAKTAHQILTICIRALDYCPPVDITFGEYLRAMITADADMVPDDKYGYRVALIEAFRRRGIYPSNVPTLSVESLRWKAPAMPLQHVEHLMSELDLDWNLRTNRFAAYYQSKTNQRRMHGWLTRHLAPGMERHLGLHIRGEDDVPTIRRSRYTKLPSLEVHSVRPARRTGPDGYTVTDLVAVLTQTREEEVDGLKFKFRGGCTLLIDLERKRIRYAIIKSIHSESRLKRQQEYMFGSTAGSLHSLYFDDKSDPNEPFAMLHRGL